MNISQSLFLNGRALSQDVYVQALLFIVYSIAMKIACQAVQRFFRNQNSTFSSGRIITSLKRFVSSEADTGNLSLNTTKLLKN